MTFITAAYTLSIVHSDTILYKSAQTIHKSVYQQPQQHYKLISPKRSIFWMIEVTDN